MTDKANGLIAAISKLQTIMQAPVKDIENTYYKSKYAGLASCFDAVRKHFEALGLAVTQPTKIVDGHVVVVTTVHHVDGDSMSSEYPVNPVKPDPQSYGSALTYARRYALCSLLGIVQFDVGYDQTE